MAGQWQRRPSAPANNGQELWAKDRVMASQNAMNTATQVAGLELEYAKLTGEPPEHAPLERVLGLYEMFYDQHLARGGDAGAAVATVTNAFPGATVAHASEPAAAPGPVGGGQQPLNTAPAGSGPGSVVIGFGKHNGYTIAQVYTSDPSYIRNYLAEKAREPELLNAARAFIAQVDAA